jgi:hypothetical protein
MRNKKTGDSDNPFHYSVLPIDPDFPDNPRPPLPENQQMAFDDIINQLIANLAIAAKDKSDPLRPFRVLAACKSIVESYTSAGFDMFNEFEHALKNDLHNALRMARRIFLRQLFLAPPHQYPAFRQTLMEIGWTSSHREAQQDYDEICRELFEDDGRWRREALAERKRRTMAPE